MFVTFGVYRLVIQDHTLEECKNKILASRPVIHAIHVRILRKRVVFLELSSALSQYHSASNKFRSYCRAQSDPYRIFFLVADFIATDDMRALIYYFFKFKFKTSKDE